MASTTIQLHTVNRPDKERAQVRIEMKDFPDPMFSNDQFHTLEITVAYPGEQATTVTVYLPWNVENVDVQSFRLVADMLAESQDLAAV